MAEYSDISEPSSPMAEGPSTTMDDHSIETVPVELTSSDEIAQWVGVNLNSEEEEEEEEELPEFNSVEELSQWLGI
jgi:predicted transcriptional regulator